MEPTIVISCDSNSQSMIFLQMNDFEKYYNIKKKVNWNISKIDENFINIDTNIALFYLLHKKVGRLSVSIFFGETKIWPEID